MFFYCIKKNPNTNKYNYLLWIVKTCLYQFVSKENILFKLRLRILWHALLLCVTHIPQPIRINMATANKGKFGFHYICRVHASFFILDKFWNNFFLEASVFFHMRSYMAPNFWKLALTKLFLGRESHLFWTSVWVWDISVR